MTSASIIIPTFNRAHLVHRAIESALNQTYPCEIILCDHGSTDQTPKVAEHYKSKIQYIRKEEDRGPIVCWRDAVEHANGEILHITYDDDWIEPTFMEKTIALLRADVGFVYTNVMLYYSDERVPSTLFRHPPNIAPMKDIVKYLLETPLTISPGCAIFRRRDILKNLLLEIPGARGRYGKNSGVGEDLLLFLLTSLDYPKYGHIKEPLACFLAHPGSITINASQIDAHNELKEAYNRAKLYYYSLARSLQPLSSLQSFLFRIKWDFKTGILNKTAISIMRSYLYETKHI
jgi:glycosyltransferase involved in cell wall biosynthesis